MWQVIGQTKPIALLQRSLERGDLSHAYLFVGPPHVGKMTLALNLAQALNCEAEEIPCTECSSCCRIAADIHSDVQVIGLSSAEKTEVGIGQIKEIQRAASLPPYEGKCKVFIIDRAELLSGEAANCLLKTLEEPSPQVLFILLTARETLLLPTIISRCQRVELSPLPVTMVKEILNQPYHVDIEKAELLARLSGGCIGWALMAAEDEQLLQERSRRLDELLELDSADHDQHLSYAAELAAQFSKSREQVEGTLSLWLNWWHDLLLVKGGCSEFVTNIDRESILVRQAKNYSLKQIKDFIYDLQTVGVQLSQNANPRLALEVLMLSMPQKV
jgi:DNA polymerase-3 subunit delta'